MLNKEKETFRTIQRIAECEAKYFPKTLKAKIKREQKEKQETRNLEESESRRDPLVHQFID